MIKIIKIIVYLEKLKKLYLDKLNCTKESYSGPLHLIESIRIALGNMPEFEKLSSSEPEHPGDKRQNRSVRTKDTSNTDRKNDTNGEMQRQKMP